MAGKALTAICLAAPETTGVEFEVFRNLVCVLRETYLGAVFLCEHSEGRVHAWYVKAEIPVLNIGIRAQGAPLLSANLCVWLDKPR